MIVSLEAKFLCEDEKHRKWAWKSETAWYE